MTEEFSDNQTYVPAEMNEETMLENRIADVLEDSLEEVGGAKVAKSPSRLHSILDKVKEHLVPIVMVIAGVALLMQVLYLFSTKDRSLPFVSWAKKYYVISVVMLVLLGGSFVASMVLYLMKSKGSSKEKY
ncbi:hypothetical protein [Carp edema virus]|nr:hypothetical protein [Carp edema virus]